MADVHGTDEGFTSVSQTMRDISQTFESSLKGKDHEETAQENIKAYVGYQDWLQTTQQMQNGFMNAVVNDSSENPEQTQNMDSVTNKIATLQEELLAESTKHGIKELIVRSAQLANRLQELMFPQQPHPEEGSDEKGEGKEVQKKKTWATELCERQRTLSSDILAHHNAHQSLQDEVDQRKRNIRDLQASNVELMKRLESIESKEKNNTAPSRILKKRQEELESLVNQITMERGILQGLIIGSGVNWAKDDHLKEMLLGLGRPLDLDE